jgi:hypothetical protein
MAMAPMASIGYRLRVDILLAGWLPYGIYLMAAWLNRTHLLPVMGGLLAASQLWLLGQVDIQADALAQDKEVFLWSLLSTGSGAAALRCDRRSGRIGRQGRPARDRVTRGFIF